MKHHNKKILSYIITTAVIAVAALWVGNKFIHLGNIEFTDNAQVRQQIVPVNSRVQGYIKEIRFREYAKVKKGDTLVIIDDADMRLNVACKRRLPECPCRTQCRRSIGCFGLGKRSGQRGIYRRSKSADGECGD